MDPARGQRRYTGRVTQALTMVLAVLGLSACVLQAPAPPPSAGGDLKPGTVPAAYAAMVTEAGHICPNITPAVIAAQIEAESNWNPNAQSSAAKGLTQFTDETWATWGKDVDGNGVASQFDPADAIDAQGRFMCSLYADQEKACPGNSDVLALALSAYNAGPGNVHCAVPGITETQNYVKKIKSLIPKYASGGSGDSAGAEINEPAPPGGKVLVMKGYIRQTTGYTCGPSSAHNALSAMIPNPPGEMELATEMHTSPNDGTYRAEVIKAMAKYANAPYTDHMGTAGLWDAVKRNIDAGRGVIVNIHHGTGMPGYGDWDGGHYIAAIGYNPAGQMILIGDSAFGDKSKPHVYWVSTTTLAGAMDSWGGYVST